jgi:hypothetical protein
MSCSSLHSSSSTFDAIGLVVAGLEEGSIGIVGESQCGEGEDGAGLLGWCGVFGEGRDDVGGIGWHGGFKLWCGVRRLMILSGF